MLILSAGFLIFIVWMIIDNRNGREQDDKPTNLAVANQFIDAFYSFNRDSLQAALAFAEQSVTGAEVPSVPLK